MVLDVITIKLMQGASGGPAGIAVDRQRHDVTGALSSSFASERVLLSATIKPRDSTLFVRRTMRAADKRPKVRSAQSFFRERRQRVRDPDSNLSRIRPFVTINAKSETVR